MNKMKWIVTKILQEECIASIMSIVTIVLLYNYNYIIKELNVLTMGVKYLDLYYILMIFVIKVMQPKGDKVVYMSVNLCSIATMLFVTVGTLDMHIASIGQATMFLDYNLRNIVEMFVHTALAWFILRVWLGFVSRENMNALNEKVQ